MGYMANLQWPQRGNGFARIQGGKVQPFTISCSNRRNVLWPYPSFLSEPFRLRLNHFFLVDLSFPSKLPSSEGLSAVTSSAGTLLLLLPLALVATVLVVVNEEWILSLSFRSSSTWKMSCHMQAEMQTKLFKNIPTFCWMKVSRDIIVHLKGRKMKSVIFPLEQKLIQ